MKNNTVRAEVLATETAVVGTGFGVSAMAVAGLVYGVKAIKRKLGK